MNWFDRYLLHHYQAPMPPDFEIHTFLSGSDCYALRCAVLHEGTDDITSQKAREALERFIFVAPRPGLQVHCNQYGAQLQLQVDAFCEEICGGIEEWEADPNAQTADVAARMKELVAIR